MRFRATALAAILLLAIVLLLPATAAAVLGMQWSESADGGIQGSYNLLQRAMPAAVEYDGDLYFGTKEVTHGCQVWRYDGANWNQVNSDGFGDEENYEISSMAVSGTDLYVATRQLYEGCEVWKYNGAAWSQVNTNGFGDADNYAAVLAEFSGDLYAGVSNATDGCRVVKYDGGATWTQVNYDGFGDTNNKNVGCMASFGSRLYVGVHGYTGCKVWRTGGTVPIPYTDWAQVNTDGFGDSNNVDALTMAVWTGKLYVGTKRGTGCQVWGTDGTGSPLVWAKVNTNGFGDANNTGASSVVEVTDGTPYLYVGTDNSSDVGTGTEVWRWDGSNPWERVNTDGYGDQDSGTTDALVCYGGNLYSYVEAAGNRFCEVRQYAGGTTWDLVGYPGFAPNNNGTASCMVTYGTDLYVGTQGYAGCELFRYDGATWTCLVGATGTQKAAGFGDYNNTDVESLAVHNGKLYLGTENTVTGAEVWERDGANWNQVNTDGFGSDKRYAARLIDYNGVLHAGISNATDGSQVGKYDETPGSWTIVSDTETFDAGDEAIGSMEVFGGKLYVGTYNMNGCNIYNTAGAGGPPYEDWAQVNASGFGTAQNRSASCMEQYGSSLYAGTTSPAIGCEVWRYSGSGTSWTKVAEDGFWTQGLYVENGIANGMEVFGDRLYVGSGYTWGSSVWRYNGSYWTQVNDEGFGNGANTDTTSLCAYGGTLYAGTRNNTQGCEVWKVTSTSQAPHIDTLNPGSGNVGDTVIVSGSGLGVPRASSYVTFNGTTATEYLEWYDDHLSCRVPSGATTGPVVVHNSDGASNGLTFTMAAQPPQVTGMTPYEGPPVTEVALSGIYFGSARGASYVQIGDAVHVTEYTSWSDNQVKFLVPEMGFGDFPVYLVTPNGTAYAGSFAVRHSVWYLAEGTTAWGFNTYITMENPNSFAVTADMTYMTTGGPVDGGSVNMPATSQATVFPADVLGNQDFSTKVVCREGASISVDRTMEWTGPGAASPGAHSSIGVTRPAGTWYLPEGSSNWGFETWLLIQNPNSADATCQVTYMIEGKAPVVLDKVVPANSRRSYNMADDIGAEDASIKVTSDKMVIPERAMYRNNRREGHDSIGTTTTSSYYYLAEGTTAWGFTTYVLIQNPNDRAVDVTLTYMTPAGEQPQPPINIPAQSRKTVRVNDFLLSSDVSTEVHGTLPIIAERAMYWDNGTGEAMHDSIGLWDSHSNFYLPDGETGGAETWVLVQNPNASAIDITVYYLKPDGTMANFYDTVPASSRKTYNMKDQVPDGRAAVWVSCPSGWRFMAERAMYWNNRGAGADTIGSYSD